DYYCNSYSGSNTFIF
nr:immunoglobulin light chain junction region [Macaca mulatta]